MKKIIPAIIAALLLVCICFSFFMQNKHEGEMALSIKNSSTGYTFKASFYAGSTPAVTRYLDSCSNILRKKDANFRIKISEGNLVITANTGANSPVTIAYIRNMCQGISDVLFQH